MSEQGEAYVHDTVIGRLATVDKLGMPHCVPVCYAVDPEGHFLVMTEAASRKARNIMATGTAAIVVDDGGAVRGVLARGLAKIIDDQQSFERAQLVMLAAGALSRPRAYGEQVIVKLSVREWIEWGITDVDD